MELRNFATQMLIEKLGGTEKPEVADSALNELLDAGDNFDLGNIVGLFAGIGGGAAGKLQSWLGDGANDAISPDELELVLGPDKLGRFAERLGISREEARSGLSEVLPQLIDRGSRGGSLLGASGIAGAVGNLAAKFLK